MTVAELIEKLQTMPQDLEVMRADYEQGPCDIYDVEVKNDVFLNKTHVLVW